MYTIWYTVYYFHFGFLKRSSSRGHIRGMSGRNEVNFPSIAFVDSWLILRINLMFATQIYHPILIKDAEDQHTSNLFEDIVGHLKLSIPFS